MGAEQGGPRPTGEGDSLDPNNLAGAASQMESEKLDEFLVDEPLGRVRRLASLGVSGAISRSRSAADIGRKLAGRGTSEQDEAPGETS